MAGAATLLLLVAACSSPESGAGAAPNRGSGDPYQVGIIGAGSGGAPVEGGTLTFGSYSEPRSLDPAVTIVAGSTGGLEMAAVYDVLMRWDSETNTVEPQLAESLEANEDATVWTLTLRDGVTFSDGTPLDAEAVRWSLERYVAAGADEAGLFTNNVTGIDTPDDRTVVFTLATEWPTFDYLLTTGPGMIVARSADEGDSFTPVGAGAFTFVSYAPQEEMVLEARDDYWDGRPHLDRIRIAYVNDPQARYDSFRAGDLDSTLLREPDLVDEALSAGTSGFLNLVALGNVAVINASEGRPGADPRVRQAMFQAVNPELVMQRAFEGAGIASNAIFPEYSRWHTGVDPLPYDPEAARALLEAAKADGFDGRITHLDGSDPASRATALAVQASLEAVGFEVETELLPTVADQIARVAVNRDYDVAGWGISWREAGPYGRMYATLHEEGNLTVGMPTTPEMSALITEFQGAGTEEEQREIMGRIQEQWNTDVPALVFAPTPEFLVWSDAVHGAEGTVNSMILLDDAWLDAGS
ncbi:ABC transporter substrate-binding protein [Geodermatophilus marinus]|uniref:ABC transporter substrate-binding protein n=1 Tax=Geodermatophilus sp. LHW52908 TaxID=2303986 RepID=UPI0018F2BC57|nr:ABC transporter substrate-binding protein [Geodermatophilus sp. LHW52908]